MSKDMVPTETDRSTTMTDQTIPVDKLRALLAGGGSAADKIQAIRDLLPPVLPDPLFGARATHPEYGEGIVASRRPENDGRVWFIFPSEAVGSGTQSRWVEPSTLTFHTPDHPVFLETEEDYRSAPEGTIVAEDELLPCILTRSGWVYPPEGRADDSDMAGIRRRVLRWGREA